MAPERLALFLPTETPEDRLSLVDLLGAPVGSERAIAVPVRGLKEVRRLTRRADVVIGVLGPGPGRVVPARHALLLGGPIGGAAEVRVELGALVADGDPGLIRAYFENALELIGAARVHAGAPPLRAAPPTADAWRAVVDALVDLAIPGLETTAFLRVSGVAPSAGAMTVEADAYAPMATREARDSTILRVLNHRGSEIALEDWADSISVAVPDAEDAIRIQASGALRGEMLARLPLVASAPTKSFVAVEPADQRPVQPAAPANPVAVRSLLDFGEHRLGAQGPALAEFAQQIAAAVGADPALAYAEARGYFQARDLARAAEVLRSVPEIQRRPEAEGMLIICELGLGRTDLEPSAFERAAFDDHLFPDLIDAVEKLPPGPRDEAVELLSRVLSAPRAAAVTSRVRSLLRPGPALPLIARRIAEASPTDAIDLLERAASTAELSTDALEILIDLRLASEQAGVGDAVAILVDRHLAAGRISEATTVIERCAPHMHPTESVEIANRILAALGAAGRALDDDELIHAMTALGVVARGARAIRAADLAEAIAAAATARGVLTPVPPDLEVMLEPLEAELLEAWEATEVHRAALAEQEQSLVPGIRDRWRDRRVLVVGGRRPSWWEPLRAELGLSDKSRWVPSEPGRRPSITQLRATLGAGKVDLLVVVVDYIAHATSDIKEFADDKDIPIAETTSGRLSLLVAMLDAA